MFFLIDLDGTLLDSDHLHYEAWSKLLNKSPEEIKTVIDTIGMNEYLKKFPDPEYMKRCKMDELLKSTDIQLIKNADMFIQFITDNDINHAVVTHTDREIVDHFRTEVPILNQLNNWVVREDYDKPKPDPECYDLALNLYGRNDKNIIGFENSPHGLKSLRSVTNRIFTITPTTDYSKIVRKFRVNKTMHKSNLKIQSHGRVVWNTLNLLRI
jgi:beta-phosphoglucomutase